MGAVNRISTMLKGERRFWTVKRACWNQFTEEQLRREVDFTSRCAADGVPAPRSIPRTDGDGYLLAERLQQRAPDIAELIRARRSDLRMMTNLLNSTRHSDAVWCHNDIGANNLIWADDGPQLIDWEDAGPRVPRQELGYFLRSIGSLRKAAYRAYRHAGGPAQITEPAHLAGSVAEHLNGLGSQLALLLDDTHPEQHEYARATASDAATSAPTLGNLEELIEDLVAG